MTTQSYKDAIAHIVKFNPSKRKSGTYKIYLKPFDSGMPEQWLKFMAKLKIIISSNGLMKDGLAHFNMMCSSLKGEALWVFNDKAKELSQETVSNYHKCLQALMEHVFPSKALQKQKHFMQNSVYLHLNDRLISEFCA
jgi:hypothetical protein